MNPLDYQFRIISSLKRGMRPKEISIWLGLSRSQVNGYLQNYRRKYRVFSNRGLIQVFGGYLT